MEAPLQQRIVGAIVLVTLGVIFIPALLDGSGYKARQVKDIQVKEKPHLPPLSQKKVKPIKTPLGRQQVQLTAKQGSANKESAKQEAGQQAGKQQAGKQQKTAEHKSRTKKPLKSFALQTGTFDTYENAEVLRDKLRKAGYTSFIDKAKVKGKTRYKVRIGPELDYDALDKVKAKIKKSHKIDAYIINYP